MSAPRRGWTVGQLRAALADVPDTLPVVVLCLEKPGGSRYDEHVVATALPAKQRWNPTTQDFDDLDYPNFFAIETDFPTDAERQKP